MSYIETPIKKHGVTSWTEGGNGITNFSECDRHIYQEAIDLSGESLFISDEGMSGYGPCLCESEPHNDLSRFWRIFDLLKKEKA